MNKTDTSCPQRRFARMMPVWGLVSVSLLLPLLFNPYIFHEEQGALLSIAQYLTSGALTLFILTLSCRVRTLGFTLLPLILVCAMGDWFIYHTTGGFVSGAIVASILETDMHEAAPYLSFTNIGCVVLAIGLLVWGVLAGHKKITPKSSNILMLASLGAFGICLAVSHPLSRHWISTHGDITKRMDLIKNKEMSNGMLWPLRDVRTVQKYIKTYYACEPQKNERIMGLPSGYEPPAEDAGKEGDVIVVMMIGESVRADHWKLNGYGRDTTPLLGVWQEKGQLISYRNTYSYGLRTRYSIIGIMTDAEVAARTPRHRPFFDMLAKDGVETVSLLAQDEDADFGIFYLSQDCAYRYTVNPDIFAENHLHGQTLVEFRKALAGHGQADRAFFLVYDTGAHMPAISLPANKKFLPDDVASPKTSPQANIINAYDNSLLEIDWELDALLRELESTGRPAVFIYASDHGEALGEDGYYAHCVPVEPVYRPAFMVWMSQAYMEKHPDRMGTLQSHADKTVSHNHLMHTVLSLFGIQRGAYKPEWDLLTPGAQSTVAPEDPNELDTAPLPEP